VTVARREAWTATAYRPDGSKLTIEYRKDDELFERADTWGAVRLHIPGEAGGWMVKVQGEWYWL